MSANSAGSGFGEDLLGSEPFEAVDSPGSQHRSVGSNLIRRPSAATDHRSGGFPQNGELVPRSGSDAADDRSGDDPLDNESVHSGAGDHHGSGVFATGGIDTVHGIRTGQTGLIVPANGEVARERSEVEKTQENSHTNQPPDSFHGDNSTTAEQFKFPRWLKALFAGMAVLIIGAMSFAIFEPIQVLPRLRLAPGFSLVDQNGDFFNSESARGSVTLYNFAPTSCDQQCQSMSATMLDVQKRIRTDVDLGSADFTMVTVALDPANPTQLSQAAASVGADGNEWRWIGSDDDSNLRRAVGVGFQRFYETTDAGEIRYDPSFVLVDGNGVVRGDYRYGTLADDGEKLARHVGILADEIRNANGAAAVAYEAAHLFLCYP